MPQLTVIGDTDSQRVDAYINEQQNQSRIDLRLATAVGFKITGYIETEAEGYPLDKFTHLTGEVGLEINNTRHDFTVILTDLSNEYHSSPLQLGQDVIQNTSIKEDELEFVKHIISNDFSQEQSFDDLDVSVETEPRLIGTDPEELEDQMKSMSTSRGLTGAEITIVGEDDERKVTAGSAMSSSDPAVSPEIAAEVGTRVLGHTTGGFSKLPASPIGLFVFEINGERHEVAAVIESKSLFNDVNLPIDDLRPSFWDFDLDTDIGGNKDETDNETTESPDQGENTDDQGSASRSRAERASELRDKAEANPEDLTEEEIEELVNIIKNE